VLILAFDTAKSIATSALVRGETVLGERTTNASARTRGRDALLGRRRLPRASLTRSPSDRAGAAYHRRTHGSRRPPAGSPLGSTFPVAELDAGRHSRRERRTRCRSSMPKRPRALPRAEPARSVARRRRPFEAPGRTCVGDGRFVYQQHLESARSRGAATTASCTVRAHAFTPRLRRRDFGPADLVEADLLARARRRNGCRRETASRHPPAGARRPER